MKRFGEVVRAVGGVWRTLAAISGLLAIVLLPVKWDEAVKAYPVLRGLMTREAALIAFAIVCVGYIAWIDWRRLTPTWLKGKPMPLAAATALLYSRASPALRDMAVTVTNLSDKESPAEYFTFMLTTLHENGVVTLLGRKAPDLVLEPIPRAYFDSTTGIEGGNAREMWASASVDWYDIHVSRPEALKGLKEYEIDERRAKFHKRA